MLSHFLGSQWGSKFSRFSSLSSCIICCSSHVSSLLIPPLPRPPPSSSLVPQFCCTSCVNLSLPASPSPVPFNSLCTAFRPSLLILLCKGDCRRQKALSFVFALGEHSHSGTQLINHPTLMKSPSGCMTRENEELIGERREYALHSR